MLKICAFGGIVFAAIAFLGWIISLLVFAFGVEDQTIIRFGRACAAINAVSLILAVIFIAVGLIMKPQPQTR